jgi:hypothetical protein
MKQEKFPEKAICKNAICNIPSAKSIWKNSHLENSQAKSHLENSLKAPTHKH